jgi:hypothetical protein
MGDQGPQYVAFSMSYYVISMSVASDGANHRLLGEKQCSLRVLYVGYDVLLEHLFVIVGGRMAIGEHSVPSNVWCSQYQAAVSDSCCCPVRSKVAIVLFSCCATFRGCGEAMVQ